MRGMSAAILVKNSGAYAMWIGIGPDFVQNQPLSAQLSPLAYGCGQSSSSSH